MTFKHWARIVEFTIAKLYVVIPMPMQTGEAPFMSGWGRGTVYRLWCRANPIQRHQWAKYNYLPLAEANQPEFFHILQVFLKVEIKTTLLRKHTHWELSETIQMEFRRVNLIGWTKVGWLLVEPRWHSVIKRLDLLTHRPRNATSHFHLATNPAKINKTQPFNPFRDIWMTTPHTLSSLEACMHSGKKSAIEAQEIKLSFSCHTYQNPSDQMI